MRIRILNSPRGVSPFEDLGDGEVFTTEAYIEMWESDPHDRDLEVFIKLPNVTWDDADEDGNEYQLTQNCFNLTLQELDNFAHGTNCIILDSKLSVRF
jgi:hypothetical protein